MQRSPRELYLWDMRKLSVVLALLCVALVLPALAATITVTTTSDDLTPNDGSVSLREAIAAINAGTNLGDPDIIAQSPGTFGTNDKILFSIPGSGLHTIAPAANLPIVTKAVIIDGYSQPGASANTLAIGDNAILQIELTGSGVSGGTGLNFSSAVTSGEVRGLLLTQWKSSALLVNGATNTTIDGNFFGTNASGTTASPFTTANDTALFIAGAAANNTFGGATAAARNLISGNNSAILMGNSGTTNNVIQNNYIGTNAAGTGALPNLAGISINSADANTIRGNVISGNTTGAQSPGIIIGNLSNHIQVVGNKIGTNAAGNAALPNSYGIIITDGLSGGSTSNTIGTLAEPNIIAFNTKAGVALTAPSSNASRLNTLQYNSIYSNGTLGIDLGDDGITPNDPGDGDIGLFNDLQNYPVLTSAQRGPGTLTIVGTLNSKPLGVYKVQFFLSPACDPSGAGEGQTFLGEGSVVTDASGIASFNLSFVDVPGSVVTATATDPLGNTSEFSFCQTITTPAAPQISISDAQVIEGNSGTTTMTFIVTVSAISSSTVTVNYATADQTATAGSDYVATSGTVTFTPGQTTKGVNITVNGDTTPEPDETLLVNLTNPTNATILRGQGVGTIRNDDNLSTLSIGDVTLNEGNSGTTSFNFPVTLSPASAFTVTVSYVTVDGTASAGSDYQSASGTVTFAPGQTTKTITVLVNGDVTTEPDETFFVNLFNPSNAAISAAQATGTIKNDDPLPSITINDPSVVEGNSGTKNMIFVITLSDPSSTLISVPFSLADSTATVGSDYLTNSGAFTVPPGAVTASVAVSIVGDTNVEPDETFFMNLGATAGATISKSQGVGTIINDDGLASPGISISDVSLAEGNSGTTNFTFTVSLTASSASTITVNYATANGTATAGSDYVAAAGTLTFTPGQTSQNLTILVNGDTVFEPNETFFVNLTNPTNAGLIKSQGLGTILNDDVVATADLLILKTGAASAAVSTNVTYTITVTNQGPNGATAVKVTDVLPAGTTFVSSLPSQGSCLGTTTVTCTLGTLNNGSSATVMLTIKMPAASGSISNTASVTATENDPVPANNSSSAPTNVTGGAPPASGVPTLSGWMLLLLGAALGGAALSRTRC
jgi:uncharacterized repeat protein (TIGR01451 family)/CSLREA domain-containing protein